VASVEADTDRGLDHPRSPLQTQLPKVLIAYTPSHKVLRGRRGETRNGGELIASSSSRFILETM